jgi:DNA primase
MSLVDQIRAKLELASFVAPYTNGLKPSGDGWFTGRCPFHQSESDPPDKRKFWVDARPGRQLCGCFVPRCQAQAPGGGKPMDIINFYARLKHVSNNQAIRDLAKLAGLR